MLRLAVLLALLAPATAAQPIETRDGSLQGYRNEIAFFGAMCLLGLDEIPEWYPDVGGMTLEDISAETGVDAERIRAWAMQRAAEHSIASRVLTDGHEPPYPDPPEPFLTLLRQVQDDCQTFIQRRRQLDAVQARSDLPDHPTQTDAPILRPAIDPIPFDRARWKRLSTVIAAIPDVMAEGVAAQDLQDLFDAITERSDIDIARYTEVETRRDADRLALSLLVPRAKVVPGITRAELIELARRAQDGLTDYGPPLYLYYFEMVRQNTGGAGTWQLFLEPDPDWLERIGGTSPTPEQFIDEALRRSQSCRFIPILDIVTCTSFTITIPD